MKYPLLLAGVVAVALASPVAAQAQGIPDGAAHGAYVGGQTAGPVGAVVGGAVGGIIGGVEGVLGVGPVYASYPGGYPVAQPPVYRHRHYTRHTYYRRVHRRHTSG